MRMETKEPERLSLTSREIRYATWIAFFAWVFAVYDFILFGTLLPEIGNHVGWSIAYQAEIATWVALGTAAVALLVGPVVDRLGRRTGIIFTISGAALCSALTALGSGAGSLGLILIRSLGGFGYAEQTVNATYLSELYSESTDATISRRRGFIYSLVQGGWPVGALLASALTAVLLPVIGWKGCFLFAAVPSLIVAFFARHLKESPQFEAYRREPEVVGHSMQPRGFAGLFQGPARRATLVLGAAFLLNWFAIQVFSVLGTTVITNVHHVSFQNSLVILILSNLVGYCGYLSHGFLGDRMGRRNVVALGWILGGLAFACMLYGPHDMMLVIGLYSVGLFFLIGPYAALLYFVGESFPTSIRATGGALVGAMGPVGAILAGLGATTFLNAGSSWQVAAFWFGAVPCVASGLVILAARHVDTGD